MSSNGEILEAFSNRTSWSYQIFESEILETFLSDSHKLWFLNTSWIESLTRNLAKARNKITYYVSQLQHYHFQCSGISRIETTCQLHPKAPSLFSKNVISFGSSCIACGFSTRQLWTLCLLTKRLGKNCSSVPKIISSSVLYQYPISKGYTLLCQSKVLKIYSSIGVVHATPCWRLLKSFRIFPG